MQSSVSLLQEIQRYLELKGENPFKVRAFEKAADALEGVREEELDSKAREGTLTEIAGIGKGIAEVLTEFLLTGDSKVRDELRQSLPPGLLELTELPGLGPKKARVLIDELDIHSIRELEYACRENRIAGLKGFGEKLQAKLLEAIAFQQASAGSLRIDEAETLASEVLAGVFQGELAEVHVVRSGQLRRRMETVSRLEFLVELPDAAADGQALRREVDRSLALWRAETSDRLLPVEFAFAASAQFGAEWVRHASSAEHWNALGAGASSAARGRCADEAEFYRTFDLPLIPPECRETGVEVELARKGALASLVSDEDIRGIFHVHTTMSDGTGSLEEMVQAASAAGYAYIGVTDHSQSAYYAQGLKPADLKAQEKEIRKLQERYPEIRIFWGIESDILADGSLDYDSATLKRFDFVIASIHSRFQMGRAEMTDRIIAAIRNPATRILGHPTGRLLLGRKGYELDMERVIREAAAHEVAMEINAHPARLDLDWRWGPLLRELGSKVAINPDAHAVAGIRDVQYGVVMARKALLDREQVINTLETGAVASWLAREVR